MGALYLRALVEPATFSPCRRYRYTWTRQFTHESWRAPKANGIHGSPCVFVMLNPSTADEARKDPTVTRCQGFAANWGYETLIVLNLFAYRATDPADMKGQDDPVGPHNDDWIRDVCLGAIDQRGIVVCAWGTHAAHLDRERQALTGPLKGVPLHFLTLTKHGSPGHPLYLSKALRPIPWVR